MCQPLLPGVLGRAAGVLGSQLSWTCSCCLLHMPCPHWGWLSHAHGCQPCVSLHPRMPHPGQGWLSLTCCHWLPPMWPIPTMEGSHAPGAASGEDTCEWPTHRAFITQSCLWPHRLEPARLLCPWDSPGKDTGVGRHCSPPGDLPNPGNESRSPSLQADSYHLSHQRSLNLFLKSCPSSLIPIIHLSEISCYESVLSTLYLTPKRVQEMLWVFIKYLFTEWMNELLS